MSNSKVLTKMWRDMKENFQTILLKAKLEDKLPSRKELLEHQESVQDLIDIFVTISNSGDVKPTKRQQTTSATEMEVQSSSEHINEESTAEKRKSTKSRTRRTVNEKQLDHIWSAYVQNHMQYLSRVQVQAIARDLDRSEDSIQYHLRKMIAAHREVPIADVMNDAFTKSEDKAIWRSYVDSTNGGTGNDGEIVASLSHDLHRSADIIHNRLQWLKDQHGQQRHQATLGRSPDATPAAKLRHREHQQETKHTHHRNTQDSSAAEEPSREQRRNKWYTSEEDKQIEKAHRQDNLSPAEIGKEVGRSAMGIEHRLRELQRNNASSHASAPTDRASPARRHLPQRIDRSDDSSDESTFEVVSKSNSSAREGCRGRSARADHAVTPASTSTTEPTSAASFAALRPTSAAQWFEDGRFSNAPYDRRAGVGEGGDRKRRKRAADFMQDAFQCDTFDAGIDSYSDMDYD